MKKIIVWSIFAGFVAVMVFGAVNRTSARTAKYSADATRAEERTGSDLEKDSSNERNRSGGPTQTDELGGKSGYGLNNTTILGEAWGNTITDFLQRFPIDWDDTSPTGTALIAKNAKQWHLIGDPSLMIGGYAI